MRAPSVTLRARACTYRSIQYACDWKRLSLTNGRTRDRSRLDQPTCISLKVERDALLERVPVEARVALRGGCASVLLRHRVDDRRQVGAVLFDVAREQRRPRLSDLQSLEVDDGSSRSGPCRPAACSTCTRRRAGCGAARRSSGSRACASARAGGSSRRGCARRSRDRRRRGAAPAPSVRLASKSSVTRHGCGVALDARRRASRR